MAALAQRLAELQHEEAQLDKVIEQKERERAELLAEVQDEVRELRALRTRPPALPPACAPARPPSRLPARLPKGPLPALAQLDFRDQVEALKRAEEEHARLLRERESLSAVLATEATVQYGPCLAGREFAYRAVLVKAGKVVVEHTERQVRLQVATAPFAQGGLRQAFWAK